MSATVMRKRVFESNRSEAGVCPCRIPEIAVLSILPIAPRAKPDRATDLAAPPLKRKKARRSGLSMVAGTGFEPVSRRRTRIGFRIARHDLRLRTPGPQFTYDGRAVGARSDLGTHRDGSRTQAARPDAFTAPCPSATVAKVMPSWSTPRNRRHSLRWYSSTPRAPRTARSRAISRS